MSNAIHDNTAAILKLLTIMDCLRDPIHGCPWDLEQDFASIAPHTLEEVYEVIGAIETGDRQDLMEELGDLLFQVVFYARLAREEGSFDFNNIAATMAEKLLRRHPHVFPDGTMESFGRSQALDSGQVLANWEQIKSNERAEKQSVKGQQEGNVATASQLDDIPNALPALQRAEKLQKRAARTGFDWQEASAVLAKVDEELAELRIAMDIGRQQAIKEEFGDLLFTMVNLSRHLGIDAEAALRESGRKFERRFRSMETQVREAGSELVNLDAEQMEVYWERAKKEL
jgi:ATP diphosphatase